jgi:DNA repair exonuclease SbcCD ATPase subunit
MNEQQPQLDEIGAALLKAGGAVDSGAPDAAIELPSLDKKDAPKAASAPKVEDKPTVQDLPPDGDKKPEVQKVESDKSEIKTQTEKQTEVKDDPNESKYVKAKKDAERKDKSWKALEQEKAEIRKKAEEIEARAKALEEEKAKLQKPAEDRSEVLLETAKKYDEAAKEFESKGRDDLAEACKAKAKACRELIEKNKTEALASKQKEFNARWDKHVEVLTKENPELADAKSELYQDVEKVLRDRSVLTTYPDGIRDAVQLSKLRLEHKKFSVLVPDLQKQLTEAKAKITELEKSTQIPTAGASSRGRASRPFNEMSKGEQEQYLKSEAMALDES